jgi:hypothetical protein
MSKLSYTEEELFRSHDYARPHEIGGHTLHGGFDAEGNYIPPRARDREEALAHWAEALRSRGGDLMDADSSLLSGPRMPNTEQQRLLLREGLGQNFWNGLTITGKIEGRGRILAEMEFPNLQDIIVEDISEMAIGHLNKGLLAAHGIDEGGEPDKDIGGHDVMWFVARDLAYGPDAFPDVEPPENIARPELGKRWMPEIEQVYEGLLSFLMNLLVIEFRAEIGFASTQAVLRTSDLFTERRADAEEAAEIIERIRTDEEIHVRSLCLYLGELRELTFKTLDGGTIKGAELLDRFWDGLIGWATVEQPKVVAENQYAVMRKRILEADDGTRILREFDAISDLNVSTAAAG